jgi:surface polysaccharide O-acyltransferase-like enzyme
MRTQNPFSICFYIDLCMCRCYIEKGVEAWTPDVESVFEHAAFLAHRLGGARPSGCQEAGQTMLLLCRGANCVPRRCQYGIALRGSCCLSLGVRVRKLWRSSTTVLEPRPIGFDRPQVLSAWRLPRAELVPLPLSLPAERVVGMDLLRIMAAVGIIWFHTEGAPYRAIGYAGLPTFLLIFFALIARQGRSQDTRYFLKRRWDRLLKPWLCWSLVYGVARLVKAAYSTNLSPLAHLLSMETVLAGTAIHLWYLPYAFISGLLIHLLNRHMWRIDDRLVVFLATLLGVFALVVCTPGTYLHRYPLPLPQWEFGLAAVPLGLAIGRSLTISSCRAQILLLSMVCAATLGSCAVLAFRGLGSASIPYGLAIVLVCLACRWRVGGNGFVAAVASLTFGVYLIHPLVIYGQRHLLAAGGHYAASIALTACISGLITWGLMKTPLRRMV